MVFTKNGHSDYFSIMALIDALSEVKNISIGVKEEALYSLMNRIQVPCKNGIENANIFKKSSAFLCEFVNGGDGIIESIKNDQNLPETITNTKNYESAFVGFYIVCVFLKHATVNKDKVINNSIQLSEHSHADIIDALSMITLSTNFKMVAVLLEQLVYKTNSDLQNQCYPLN